MENQINRPYLAFDSVLSEALQHTLPQIIPPAHDEDAQYPLPSVVYRMFDYTDVPEVYIFPLLVRDFWILQKRFLYLLGLINMMFSPMIRESLRECYVTKVKYWSYCQIRVRSNKILS